MNTPILKYTGNAPVLDSKVEESIMYPEQWAAQQSQAGSADRRDLKKRKQLTWEDTLSVNDARTMMDIVTVYFLIILLS